MTQPFGPPAGYRHRAAKVIVTGGFGVGKTTFVAALSEVKLLQTDVTMTAAARDVAGKAATTVEMDFARITIDGRSGDHLVPYLSGLPGKRGFRYMWHAVAAGSVAAVVLAYTRRPVDAVPTIDFRRLPRQASTSMGRNSCVSKSLRSRPH